MVTGILMYCHGQMISNRSFFYPNCFKLEEAAKLTIKIIYREMPVLQENGISSYSSLFRISQVGLLQSIKTTRTRSIWVRIASATSKRKPDLNWHTQYEKLLFHITRSLDTDLTSGLVNSVAQKNKQRSSFILSLHADTPGAIKLVTSRLELFLASHSIITAARERAAIAVSYVSLPLSSGNVYLQVPQ